MEPSRLNPLGCDVENDIAALRRLAVFNVGVHGDEAAGSNRYREDVRHPRGDELDPEGTLASIPIVVIAIVRVLGQLRRPRAVNVSGDDDSVVDLPLAQELEEAASGGS